MKQKIFITTIFFLNLMFVSAQENFKGAGIGFIINDLKTGEVVYEQNPDLCLAPASVSKIITTATALEILGADFRFQTTLKYDGEIRNGVLFGNLYICGGGDATLGSRFFSNNNFLEEFYKALKNSKITEVKGYVIPNAEIFDDEAIPFGWAWEDIANSYGAGVYGLSVWDNTVKVTFKSGAQGTTPEIIKIVPKIDGFVFENHLVARKNCGDSAYFYGMPYDNKRLIFGAIEANKDSFTVKTDISNPPLAAAKALSGYLTEKGIKTYGVKTNSKPPLTPPQGENANSTLRGAGGLRTLHIYFSPPLSAIIKSTNHHSNNSFAEHILKYLSIDEKNQQGTLARSLDVVKKFWASKGLDVSTFFIQDGSGLSPHSAISAKFVNDVLIYMANESKNRAVFLESLPTAGKSGTVKNFLKDTPLQGKAFLKSGSIARVQCYAGYIIDDERSYAITILVNNFSGKRKDVVKEIEQMILRNFYARR